MKELDTPDFEGLGAKMSRSRLRSWTHLLDSDTQVGAGKVTARQAQNGHQGPDRESQQQCLVAVCDSQMPQGS